MPSQKETENKTHTESYSKTEVDLKNKDLEILIYKEKYEETAGRYSFIFSCIAILGFIIPLVGYISFKTQFDSQKENVDIVFKSQQERINSLTQKMESYFKDMKEPKFECYYEGVLLGKTIIKAGDQWCSFSIKNIGNGSASNIRAYLLLKDFNGFDKTKYKFGDRDISCSESGYSLELLGLPSEEELNPQAMTHLGFNYGFCLKSILPNSPDIPYEKITDKISCAGMIKITSKNNSPSYFYCNIEFIPPTPIGN